MTPETRHRLLVVRAGLYAMLKYRQAGGDNARGVRALHSPGSHPDAWRDAKGDATVALTIMALNEVLYEQFDLPVPAESVGDP
jgi:hypothetical protein